MDSGCDSDLNLKSFRVKSVKNWREELYIPAQCTVKSSIEWQYTLSSDCDIACDYNIVANKNQYHDHHCTMLSSQYALRCTKWRPYEADSKDF